MYASKKFFTCEFYSNFVFVRAHLNPFTSQFDLGWAQRASNQSTGF